MTNSNKRIRESWLDVVKGIGILLMVIGHANAPGVIRHWIYGFHMPLFFIITGYLYDEQKWKSRGFKALIKSRAKAYLIPYVIFFLINLICEIVFEILKGNLSDIPNIVLVYIGAGLQSHDTLMPNCAPIWFLTCIFCANILFWLLINREKWTQKVLLGTSYIIVLLLLCEFETTLGISQLPWHIDVALIASVFMLIGNAFKNLILYAEKMKNYKVFVVIIGFIISTLMIMANGRIIMVINHYSNILLFIAGATMMSFVMFILAKGHIFGEGTSLESYLFGDVTP